MEVSDENKAREQPMANSDAPLETDVSEQIKDPMDSAVSVTTPQVNVAVSLKEELLRRFRKWLLLTMDPLLLVGHLTVIYIVALKADDWVLAAISSSLDDLIQQSPFVAELLLGLKVFSALGIAIGYGLHTVYQLYLEGKHVAKVLMNESKPGMEA
jgi:hypothetical protein